MESFWLCCDPTPAKKLESKKKTKKSDSQPFFGVFNDDPSVLGRMIPRPLTPFKNEESKFIPDNCKSGEYGNSVICESPPVIRFDLDFHRKSYGNEITIF